MAQKIIEHVRAHYEVREVPFGKIYEWHPAYATLECDCGETLILSVISPITTCPWCGADLSVFLYDIPEREGEDRLPDKLTHPWFYDAKEQTEQHQHDEAAYPEGSPWRYNDITEGP